MTLLNTKKVFLTVLFLVLSGCYSSDIPKIEYSKNISGQIEFSNCEWSRLNLICRINNLTEKNIPQRVFVVSAYDAKDKLVFKELIKPTIDAGSYIEKWFESFKSRERVVKLMVDRKS
ncbi:MAG: hypothetical protein ISR69_01545 [Gammaproteobacteria bacterium]|nr:hypothetical protein [Gammaproteobacteria bacterium]